MAPPRISLVLVLLATACLFQVNSSTAEQQGETPAEWPESAPAALPLSDTESYEPLPPIQQAELGPAELEDWILSMMMAARRDCELLDMALRKQTADESMEVEIDAAWVVDSPDIKQSKGGFPLAVQAGLLTTKKWVYIAGGVGGCLESAGVSNTASESLPTPLVPAGFKGSPSSMHQVTEYQAFFSISLLSMLCLLAAAVLVSVHLFDRRQHDK
jgi:hypothetical protein